MDNNINTPAWNNFASWRDVKAWLEGHGFTLLPKRMEANNACIHSSGEFQRSQVFICDTLRLAYSEEDALELAAEMEEDLKSDPVTALF